MRGPVRREGDGPPWAWRLVVNSVVGLLRHVFGWRVRARRPEVVPPPGQPLVVVFNHTSDIDAFLVADTVWRGLRHWVRPLAKAELFEVPLLRILVRQGGSIRVARNEDAGREAAYDDAVAKLRDGGTVLLAPEGTVTHDGSLLPLRHGAARLALEAGVDVLVVTHFGAQRGFSAVVRVPERRVLVTMRMDVITPWPDEDASSLTGRIAATMLDRSEELRASYPQADPTARWWPPYAEPASPTATARENLERYRQSMAEAVAQARERMAELADEHEIEQRVTQARERAQTVAEDVAARSRARTDAFAEQARERTDAFAEQARERMGELADRAREHAPGLAELLPGNDEPTTAARSHHSEPRAPDEPSSEGEDTASEDGAAGASSGSGNTATADGEQAAASDSEDARSADGSERSTRRR